MTGPRRRASDDHNHPEYWTAEAHHRFEDRISREINNLREDLDAIGMRITLLLGGLGIMAFLVPVLAPFFRAWLNIDTPAGQ